MSTEQAPGSAPEQDQAAGQASPIPSSSALAEASPLSLGELFSRDPEGFTKLELETVVEELRKLRTRFDEAERAGKPQRGTGEKSLGKGVKPSAKSSATSMLALPAGTGQMTISSSDNPDELGL